MKEVLQTVVGNRKIEAIVRAALAQLKAMNGEFDEARALCLRVHEILVELEARLDASSTSIEASRVEILAGDLDAAETLLRRDDAALEAIDERYFRSTIAAILANVLALRGALQEADDYAGLAEELADEDDLWSQVSWRTARAKVLAHGGSVEEAIAMAQTAVDLAADSGDIEMRADALTELGRVFAIAGRRNSQGLPGGRPWSSTSGRRTGRRPGWSVSCLPTPPRPDRHRRDQPLRTPPLWRISSVYVLPLVRKQG